MKNKLFILIPTILSTILIADNIGTLPIIVKASKQESSLMTMPQSVELINNNQLEIYNVKEVNELSSIIPNANISGIGNRTDKTFTFRGISNYVTYESSIAMYLDDVPIPFIYGYGAIDIDSISSMEVLKGPQGTLFGKNAESGIINIYTKQINKKPSSKVKLEYGSNNTKKLNISSNGIVSDKLNYSASFTTNTTDGYSKNTITNTNFDYKDMKSGNIKLQQKIDENIDLKLSYTRTDVDDGGSPFKINTKQDPFNIDNESLNDYIKMDNDLISVVVKNQHDKHTFVSTTTYSKQKVDKRDFVGILGGLDIKFDIDVEEFTQELKTNYNLGNMNILIGAFYSEKMKFDHDEDQTLVTSSLSSVNKIQNPDENYAGFAQVELWNDEKYIYTAGLRYQKTKRNFIRDINQFGSSTITHSEASTTWSHTLPTLAIAYFAKNGSQTYLRYSKGYRPGGYAYRDGTTSPVPYAAQITDAIELGYKNKYNNSLYVDGTLFYNDIKDLRINTFTDTLSNTTLTAQKAYSYGAEINTKYRKDKLDVYSSLGVTKAKIKQYDANNSIEGKNSIDVPNITVSLGVKYFLDKNIYLDSSIKHMGKRYYDIENSTKEEGFTLVNLSLGYKQKEWNTQLYVNNIFNKKYVDFMIHTPSNDYYHFGTPRFIGLKLSKNF